MHVTKCCLSLRHVAVTVDEDPSTTADTCRRATHVGLRTNELGAAADAPAPAVRRSRALGAAPGLGVGRPRPRLSRCRTQSPSRRQQGHDALHPLPQDRGRASANALAHSRREIAATTVLGAGGLLAALAVTSKFAAAQALCAASLRGDLTLVKGTGVAPNAHFLSCSPQPRPPSTRPHHGHFVGPRSDATLSPGRPERVTDAVR